MRLNYLNNKDILKEIHKSKNTYCSYVTADVADYDIIITDFKNLTAERIQVAINNRNERLHKAAAESSEKTTRRSESLHTTSVSSCETDIVIRFMTFDHVPLISPAETPLHNEEDGICVITQYDSPEPVTAQRHEKCNFPPFQHYKINDQGQTYCVGKSHWKGNIESGSWSRNHGFMTPKLALMFIKLCERYATRSNWRNYTYVDEMRSQALLQLSQIGLQFDESKSSNPFAYYTAAITNSFTRVLNIEKRSQNIRDDILELNGYTPSYTRQGSGSGHSDYDSD